MITSFKPAETALLLDNRNVSLETLLGLTFFDLLLNNVLILKKEYKQIHPVKPLREYLVVETGENFSSYKNYTRFERYFLERIDESSYYYLAPYLKGIYNDIPYTNTYVSEIIAHSKNPQFYKRSLFSKIFNTCILSKSGHKANQEIKNYLDEIDLTIANNLNSDLNTILSKLLLAKGNIFLLKNLSLQLFEKLNLDAESNPEKHFRAIKIIFEPTYLFSKSVFEAIDEIFLFTAFREVEPEYIPGDLLN